MVLHTKQILEDAKALILQPGRLILNWENLYETADGRYVPREDMDVKTCRMCMVGAIGLAVDRLGYSSVEYDVAGERLGFARSALFPGRAGFSSYYTFEEVERIFDRAIDW